MLFSRRRKLRAANEAAFFAITNAPKRTDILRSLPDDHARARQCEAWAEDARAKWDQGMRECVTDMLLSEDLRYRYLSTRARELIGARKWINCAVQKDLADKDQMFSRWAAFYQGKVARQSLEGTR